MKIGLLAAGLVAGVCSSSFAGFIGWTAKVVNHGTYYTMDVFAAVDSSSDKVLNVFNMNIAAVGTTFTQGAGASNNKWRPNLGVSDISMNDSFVTLGGFDDGGVYYCADGTSADPSFSNYATSGATTIPANAGWYNSDPTSSQILGADLSAFAGESRGVAAQYGVWVAHFAVSATSVTLDSRVDFSGKAAFNSGTNAFDSRSMFFIVPGPGALALLGAAGLVSRRRRA
ncbi:MAG: hypothetical protein U0625_03500 [Phycisphaerales bacterium]